MDDLEYPDYTLHVTCQLCHAFVNEYPGHAVSLIVRCRHRQ